MVKCMFTVVFRTDLANGEALRHWRETHSKLVTAVPGVGRFTQNVVTHSLVPAWDGVAEIWFNSREAYEAALKTLEWQAVLADGPNFMQMKFLGAAVVEETTIPAR